MPLLCDVFALTADLSLAITLVVWAAWSDHIKMRYPFVLAGLIFCLVGFAINISDVAFGVKYFGTFLVVAGAYAAFPGVVAWCVSPSCCVLPQH